MVHITEEPCPGVASQRDGHLADFQIFRGTSVGRQLNHQKQPHTSIAFGLSRERDTFNDGSKYIKAQFADCVMELEDGDEKASAVRPLATLDSCQTGSSSIHNGEIDQYKGRKNTVEKKDSEISAFNNMADTDCHRTSSKDSPFGKESALIEYMITQYASLVDSTLDMGCVDTRYERPRAAPAVPKRDLPDSVKQSGGISTKESTKSGRASRNFRRLRLDIQHSNRPRCRSQSDPDSPDWACRTSLAIEAATLGLERTQTHSGYSRLEKESPDWACRTSIALEAGTPSTDSLHTYCGYSSPNHILETIRTPTKILPPERKRVQSLRPREIQSTHLSPLSRHSWTHSAANGHSEGALQLLQRAEVAHYGSMESGTGERPLKHEHVQVAPPIDLNKSLPALPSQPCEQYDKE